MRPDLGEKGSSTYSRQGRIAIFFPWPMMDSVHSLRNTALLLARHGYDVEIYTISQQNWIKPVFHETNISIISNQTGFFHDGGLVHPRWARFRLGQAYRLFVITVYRPLVRRLYLRKLICQRNVSEPYTCFIGVDPEGLVDAAYWAKLLKVPLVYYSLELLFSDEIKTKRLRELKRKEIELSQQAKFTIVQDETRARALVKENGLSSANIVLVPNAPLGLAKRRPNCYLRDKFNIAGDQKILLSAGFISEWTMSRELVQAVSTWPDEYVLVLHSRVKTDNDPYVFSLMRGSNPLRVKFSLDPVPSEEYEYLVSSADIGLVFYRSLHGRYTQTNLELVGLSSGKLASYLHCGLPVIVNDVSGPRTLVGNYQCGLCVSEPSQIADAVKRILERYEFYSANAQRCFNEQLEFAQHFKNVIERIEQL